MATNKVKPTKRSLKPLGQKEIATDIQIAAGMICLVLLSKEGIQSMAQVLKGANDAAAALAHVLFTALSKVKQQLIQRKIQIDSRVWIMGGGVLDRVLFEVMLALVTIVKFQPAGTSQFVHQVKSDVLDLMQDDDDNAESIKVLHSKGLPVPKGPEAEQQQQGLAAPQPGPQQQQAAPQQVAQQQPQQAAPQQMGAQ